MSATNYGDLPRDFEPGVNLDVRERISRRRWSPRRNRSAQVAEIDQTVARLEMRQLEIDAELRELQERRVNAPGEHAARLSTWELAGRKGPRPEPTVAELEADIRDCQAEIDGVLLAISQTSSRRPPSSRSTAAGWSRRPRRRLPLPVSGSWVCSTRSRRPGRS